jgi:hypothetical protein
MLTVMAVTSTLVFHYSGIWLADIKAQMEINDFGWDFHFNSTDRITTKLITGMISKPK